MEAIIPLALQSSLDAYAGTSALPALETISLKKELDDKFLCWICHQDLPGDYFGLVLQSSDFRIVCFRGTLSLPEWMQECATQPKGSIEDGMAVIYEALSLALQPSVLPTLFTGHSLGGALASLAALMFGKKYDFLVTFGCPKVMQWEASSQLCDTLGGPNQMVHVENIFDVVPELPWESEYGNAGTIIKQKTGKNRLDIAGNHALATYAAAYKAFAVSLKEIILEQA